jgi:hypothetical protein
VIGRAKRKLGSKGFMEVVPESRSELGTSVGDNHLRNSVEADYMGEIKLG